MTQIAIIGLLLAAVGCGGDAVSDDERPCPAVPGECCDTRAGLEQDGVVRACSAEHAGERLDCPSRYVGGEGYVCDPELGWIPAATQTAMSGTFSRRPELAEYSMLTLELLVLVENPTPYRAGMSLEGLVVTDPDTGYTTPLPGDFDFPDEYNAYCRGSGGGAVAPESTFRLGATIECPIPTGNPLLTATQLDVAVPIHAHRDAALGPAVRVTLTDP